MNMLAIPKGSPAQEIDRVWSVLRGYYTPRTAPKLDFYLTRDAVLFFGIELVPESGTMDTNVASKAMDEYFSEGRQWVRIAGMGYLTSSEYICTIDRSRETNSKATAVEISGPPLDESERPFSAARVLVGFLEAVAQRLVLTGNPRLADLAMSLYGRRKLGDWNNERLENWSLIDVCNFSLAIERICPASPTSDPVPRAFRGNDANVRRIQQALSRMMA